MCPHHRSHQDSNSDVHHASPVVHQYSFTVNKDQSNWANGDIARTQKTVLSIYSIIYSPGGSTRSEVGPASCRTPILEEGFEAVGDGNTLVTLGQNLGRKGLTDVSQIVTRSGRDVALSYAKEIASMSSAN